MKGRNNYNGSAIYLKKSYLQIPASININGDFSLIAWIKIFSYDNNQANIIDFFGSSFESLLCYNSVMIANQIGAQSVCSTQYYFQLNTWYQIAMTLNGKMVSTYVNGINLGYCNLPFLPLQDYDGSSINYLGDHNLALDAAFDDLKIFRGALTDIDIYNDYHS